MAWLSVLWRMHRIRRPLPVIVPHSHGLEEPRLVWVWARTRSGCWLIEDEYGYGDVLSSKQSGCKFKKDAIYD